MTVDSRALPWVLHPESATCAVVDHTGVRTGPQPCAEPAALTMLVRYPRSRAVWRVYLCQGHAAQLEARGMGKAVESLAGQLQIERDYRAEQYARARAGLEYRRTGPVSVGRTARR